MSFNFISVLPSYLNQTYNIDLPPNQLGSCAIFIYMTTSGVLCSTYILITMTFERLCCIVWPLKASTLITVRNARIIIVSLFVFWFSYCIPFLFIGDYKGRSCVPNRFASSTLIGKLYYWLTQIFIFIFPFTALLTMNSVIIHTLRKRSMLNLSEPTGQGQTEGQNVKMKQPEKQTFTMLLLVTFMYLILSFPLRGLAFYLNFYTGKTPSYYAGLHLLSQVGIQTFYTNHAINFLLYVMSGKKFRTDLRNVFIVKTSNKNGIPVTNSQNIS